MTTFFVQRAGVVPPAEEVPRVMEGTLAKRGGSTGQRGGGRNWRSRHCILAGHVLYYCDNVKSVPAANGHLHLQGLGIRQADDEANRLLSLCLFWPEDAEATFYVQAPNAAARDEWLVALRQASALTPESLAELGMAELKQRVVACGLVESTDYSRERAELEALLLEHVASCRAADYHNTPAAVIATTTEATTGLAKTVLATPTAKPSLISAALGMVRGAVSLNKTRFQQDGFDLDLTYITPRLIAMAYPSAGIEGYYRNDIEHVQRFLGTYHPANRYKVFNLCEERVYDGVTLGGELYPDCVHHFPFDDHNPPAFDMLHPFCVTLREWLERHPHNVAAVHCKAGKGRTGLIMACVLLHLGEAPSAATAISMFGSRRTHDGEGVTIPSQQRYVGYYAERFSEDAVKLTESPPPAALIRPRPKTQASFHAGMPPEPPGAPAAAPARSGAKSMAAMSITASFSGGGSERSGGVSLAGGSGRVGGEQGGVDESESGLWPCRLLRSLGLRWGGEAPLFKVTELKLKGAPASKYDKMGCHPYAVVRHTTLLPRELFGDKEAANGRILKCTCTTQQHVRIFDSRRHVEPVRVEQGNETTFVNGLETPPLIIKGDIKFIFYDKPLKGLKAEIGHCWIHTAFLAARCLEGGGDDPLLPARGHG